MRKKANVEFGSFFPISTIKDLSKENAKILEKETSIKKFAEEFEKYFYFCLLIDKANKKPLDSSDQYGEILILLLPLWKYFKTTTFYAYTKKELTLEDCSIITKTIFINIFSIALKMVIPERPFGVPGKETKKISNKKILLMMDKNRQSLKKLIKNLNDENTKQWIPKELIESVTLAKQKIDESIIIYNRMEDVDYLLKKIHLDPLKTIQAISNREPIIFLRSLEEMLVSSGFEIYVKHNTIYNRLRQSEKGDKLYK